MTAIFEFFFKYRPLLYEKGTLAFRSPWPLYVTWILVACALLASYGVYRRTTQVLPANWRWSLVALRSATLLILLLLLLQPILIMHTVIPQKSFVAVAYDTSKSMEIHDSVEGQSRLDIQKNLLRPAGNTLLENLGAKFKLSFFGFSNGATRSKGYEDPARHGNVTDLDRSLNQIVAELGTAPISGIVLLTDGADNSSADLSSTAMKLRARNIPVYTVGIGAPDFNRDTEITQVSAPSKVLKDTTVEADVSVRSKGYAFRKAKLVVKERGRVLQTQEITLGGDGEVKTHKINFSSETAGPKLFSFAIEPFADELVAENNDQDVLIRVEDVQPPILYAEGEPRWEYGFLRRAVQDDKNLRLISLLRQADGKFYRQGVEKSTTLEKGFPADKAELFAYKALIVGSVEASFFTFDQLRLISDFVSQRGGSFLMMGGKSSFGQGGYINTPLEDVLPVNLRFAQGNLGVPPYQDVEFKVRLTNYGVLHPVTRFSALESENRKRWEALPELVGFNPTSGAKPGATVLVNATVPDTRNQNQVLLAFQRFGRGKSMALTTGSTWRWRMGMDAKDTTQELFWKQLLRWLVSDVPDPVNLETQKNSYAPDESVVLKAEVNDGSYVHQNNAEVSATVRAPSGALKTVPMSWDVSREGQYSAAFKPEEEGVYEVSVDAVQGNKSLGTAKTNFRVADSKEEYHNAALNVELLKRLASDTGGRYYAPKDLRNLPEDISYVNNGASRIEEKDLWDMPFLFLLLVGSVSCEWMLRKRKGLA